MDFSSKEYLPGSEERLSRLRKIINGRPVAILAAGPSIGTLEERIGELRQADVCYFGLNNFFVQEEHILRKIGKSASVVMCSSREGMPDAIKAITGFLKRDEENMFISSFWRDTFGLLGGGFVLADFLAAYDRKLLFFGLSSERTVPASDLPLHLMVSNSLLAAIELALIGGAGGIAIFGADGHCGTDPAVYYYRPAEYDPQKWPGTDVNLVNDTKRYFNPLAPIAVRNIYKTYGLRPVTILNSSERSFYTPFPAVSYDMAFEFLKGGKFDTRLDLRVPTVSVIGPAANIPAQSYSNYELVSWAGGPGLKAFTGAVSSSRGEYLLYSPNADLDQDWVNTCVEILENEPAISLICGLPAGMPEDWSPGRGPGSVAPHRPEEQAREYIYYWLKNKNVFPQGGLCVRKRVFEECFPFRNDSGDMSAAWLVFNYRFNASGYLPYFIPGNKNTVQDPYPSGPFKGYLEDIDAFRRRLAGGLAIHKYRDGSGALSADGFRRGVFIISKLPARARLLTERVINFWKRHGWNSFGALGCKVRGKFTAV